MFEKVGDADFLSGEHDVLRFWTEKKVFQTLREKVSGATNDAGQPKRFSFLDGPMTANNPMGVHHAWGRTYKDAFQRYFAMTGHQLRWQNGFDCQGLWVEVEVEKQLGLGSKNAIAEYGIDKFVWECKRRVLNFAARQTEQSIRLGYWMDWDDPAELRRLAGHMGTDEVLEHTTPSGETVKDTAENITAGLGQLGRGGSYFTFSTVNNETIWQFLKTCHERGKIYRGHDVMPWSGRGGSAYSQMEVADGRKLTTHRALFVRLPLLESALVSRGQVASGEDRGSSPADREPGDSSRSQLDPRNSELTWESPVNEYLLVWTTTPWTLTANVAAAINPELDYVCIELKKDSAIGKAGDKYWFAKDNLNYKRLEKEFKEGFGRPEWSWPEGTPKLKTLGQIFKEQGGFEELTTAKGESLLDLNYVGPFDDIDAQNYPGGFEAVADGDGFGGGYGYGTMDGDGFGGGDEFNQANFSSVAAHRVIDGGRDFKGTALVVAGEGTGIVHSAPGCGDVDHQWGVKYSLPTIAPLLEDGTFGHGFGPFTGKEASAQETVDLVIDELKRKGLLVYVEKYPHIYPHCWRTGDELVFRLVDEWFINMDWRDEIKDVVADITWLPESIQGQQRETEWLTIMRDWMISKKRYWGLALPIWRDAESGDFEVFGSVDELKSYYDEHGGEGWEQFEGHTPHKPWIDAVKVKNPKTGNLMQRIEDVGNPWLDAGITPFSTMGYAENREFWEQWYPADLVLECFPGQFRNWFYSLLALSTMMRHEQDDASEKRPFKTLFGHRLVMNEHGQPMHKSDGTAIWFEEAAEQLGVDTLRWLYLSWNPATDLRFGLRHPDQPTTLQTVDGPISETKEGAPTALVTSTPADEVRRQVLIPLWNSYAFFVNYARLDGFDPTWEMIPVADRPEIDRWLISNLQVLITECRTGFDAFDTQRVTTAAAAFIEDLSAWYIRRNRRRFWDKVAEERGTRNEERGGFSDDKLAAYQTLYETLVTLTQLLAPAIPFLTERMYQNLTGANREPLAPRSSSLVPPSVHLCDYPKADESLLDTDLNAGMAAAQKAVRLGHRLREEAGHRVRQPLAELRFATVDAAERTAVSKLAEVIGEELNVKQVVAADNLDELVSYAYKPNLKTLGPKCGKRLGVIRNELPNVDGAALAPLRSGESVTVELSDGPLELTPDDVMVSTEQASDWASGSDGTLQLALSTELTPELEREGYARDLIRHIQQARKDAGLEIEDRITIALVVPNEAKDLAAAVAEHGDTIRSETLANAIASSGTTSTTVKVGGFDVGVGVMKS